MSDGPVIVIVDDEIQIRRFLRLSLEAHGYQVKESSTGEDGMTLIRSSHPDCVILDLSLPDLDGLDVLKQLREWFNNPVIVLSVRNSENDKVELLDAGANDYLTKPFSMGELLARIRAVLRTIIPGTDDGIFQNGSLEINFPTRGVTVSGKEIKLTPTEYSLLCLLAKHAGKVVMHSQIIREIWGSQVHPDESYLRVYMLQIRRKIEDDPANPKMIITEPGVGYRMLLREQDSLSAD
jgi:two-component system, OmpR family, KDP operon response regulator KdpE